MLYQLSYTPKPPAQKADAPESARLTGALVSSSGRCVV